jgi:transcriptional regulator with XRE-family HTH domain
MNALPRDPPGDPVRMIGWRLRRIRDDREKSLRVIAGLAGMSASTLHRIEQGQRAVTLSEIARLANALQVPPSELTTLPVPAPANGHTDSTIEAARLTLDAIEAGHPSGTVLPVAVLADQVAAWRFREIGDTDALGFVVAPADVGICRMWLALEADDPNQVISIAQDVHPERHPFPAARSQYWKNYGRALARLRGRHDEAVRALRTAEQIYPTNVRRDPLVREAIAVLLPRTRTDSATGQELQDMAHRVGLPVY